VETTTPIPTLHELAGVHDVQEFSGGVSFQVEVAQMGEVIKEISQYGILALESAPPTLEDLFIHHYQGER
jgi:ABC-2 type transport system ATP-binding protein